MNEKHILVEPLLFGDYRVGVWDENNNTMLDKEYFCRGYDSAMETAKEIRANLGNLVGLPIYAMRDGEPVKIIE